MADRVLRPAVIATTHKRAAVEATLRECGRACPRSACSSRS